MGPASPEPGRDFLVRICGILSHGDAVLFEENRKPGGEVAYNLPGGHLEFGETLALCLSREFYEETGLNVEADKLMYVHEYVWDNRGVRTHELGFYFLVDLSSGFPTPDADGRIPHRESHVGMRLLRLTELRRHRVVPSFLGDLLPEDARTSFAHPPRHLVTREG